MNASLKWPWLRALRPAQWIKNGIVPAAYFFAKWDPSQSSHVQGARPLLLEAAARAALKDFVHSVSEKERQDYGEKI